MLYTRAALPWPANPAAPCAPPICAAAASRPPALEITRKQESQVGPAAAVPALKASDPLREGLRHCQSLGEAALRDDDCLHLWAEQRDRFLGFKAPSGSSTSESLTPQSPEATKPGAR
ncbi:putative entry exclusion protein TrbK-alt [Mesorhizobium sp. M0006]|uniref:putative entry exclusion protein TrbK-alt n=1 Tax=Mesorhizobium sp. M0006 TaxID=2956838 RepID=UPI00333607F4